MTLFQFQDYWGDQEGFQTPTIACLCISLCSSWWRHQMETFSALLAICAGNHQSPVNFPAQRSVTRSFDVFFDLRLYKRLSKQSWGLWFETLSCPSWRHCNGVTVQVLSRTQIPKTFGSPSSRHRSHAKVSDRCPIDVDRVPVRLSWLDISGHPIESQWGARKYPG